jgi:hypothetical protein
MAERFNRSRLLSIDGKLVHWNGLKPGNVGSFRYYYAQFLAYAFLVEICFQPLPKPARLDPNDIILAGIVSSGSLKNLLSDILLIDFVGSTCQCTFANI